MGTLRYLKDLLIKHKYKYAAGIIFLLCVDALQLILPKILQLVTDNLKEGTLTQKSLTGYAAIVALIAAGIAVFRFLFRYSIFGASRNTEMLFRNRFYAHLQKLSVNYFNTHKTGDLMAHATNDLNNVTAAAGQGVIFAVDSLLIPVAATFMMLQTAGFRLTIASMGPLLLLALAVLFFMKIMQSSVQKQQEAFSNLTESARENISGIRVVKAFVQEQKEIEKFERANAANKAANLRYVRLMSIMLPSVMTISALSFIIALWYGGTLVIRGSLTLGGFVAFNSYLGMLIWPISALGWIANMFQRGYVSLGRINKILDEIPEIADSAETTDMVRIEGCIEFRDLTFSWPGTDTPVLKNISLTLETGRSLGIIGPTGSGKTTLISLILRLLTVPEGTLFIDGIDINKIPLSLLRRNIGYAPQDAFLFSTSLEKNIAFYREYSKESIENAARAASVYDEIMEFPKQFGTLTGERGVTLSGGQKQRISIARAILDPSPVLILDDCLSAVDAATEEQILRDLKTIMKKRTSIIVSHRISAVKDADEIIVLLEGKIAERGGHQALLEFGGYYSNLHAKQLLADEIEGIE